MWQRRWSGAVAASVQASPVPSLLVLAAEVSWVESTPSVAWSGMDHRLLAQRGEPIGLVIRSDAFAPGGADVVAGVVAEALGRAAAAGLEIDEVHLDVDVPTARLGEYVAWLSAVRAVSGGLPLTVTSLPDWLRSEDAGAMLQQTDGHVLQVHWLRWADQPSGPMTVLVPAEATRAVERAGELDAPFRVALPTYGYTVLRDADGDVIDVVAEEMGARLPPGATAELVQSDPTQLASLIRGWTRARPSRMRGVIWFRLPVDTDQNNWPQATLSAVMEGRVPRHELEVRAVPSGGGLHDLVVHNPGEVRAPVPRVAVNWDGDLEATDALRGGHWRTGRRCGVLTPGGDSLAPGDSTAVGWFRLTDGGTAVADVLAADAVTLDVCDRMRPASANPDPD